MALGLRRRFAICPLGVRAISGLGGAPPLYQLDSRPSGARPRNLENAMHNLVALDTLFALMLFFWMCVRVGGARARFGIAAPATAGHPEFERHFRVQMNTLEGLVVFLPSLWLFAVYVNEEVAAALGLVWIVGRILYMQGYVKDVKSRGLGFGIQALATLVLMLGSLGWIVWDLINGALKGG
jgi:glutathione S-transferase